MIKERSVTQKNGRKYRNQDNLGYLYVLPAVLMLTVFACIPLVMAVLRSFRDYNTGDWVGLSNFDYIFKTPVFLQSFGNVIGMAVVGVALQLFLSFLLAQLVKKSTRGFSGALKVIVYLPSLVSSVIVSIIYHLLTNHRGGLFANLMIIADLDPIVFGVDGIWPYVSIIVSDLWLGLGGSTLIMLAGMLSIPREYYEAAAIDGAGVFRVIFNITIPNLKNTFIFLLSTQLTGKLQMLDLPLMITGGGPANKTLTPVLYLYRLFNDGSGAPRNVSIAGSLIILVVIATLNSLAFFFLQSKKSEDA